MYDLDTVEAALALLRTGANYSEVSRKTGVARATLRSWVNDGVPSRGRARRSGTCMRCAGYRFPVPEATEFAYSYLLGLYLGDGFLARHPRGVYRLRVSLDRAYPGIVAECMAAISIVMPSNRVGIVRYRNANLDEPYAFSRHWPCVFPQHGPGMKHQRRIVLEPWQREIVSHHPWRFLRGLIQSDGCRSINTIRHPKKTYRYPRYEFSNRSNDIRNLFCEYCDKVGVEWRQMNRWNISVARRGSVALLDEHIGPKR
jgi:hypothetical protein